MKISKKEMLVSILLVPLWLFVIALPAMLNTATKAYRIPAGSMKPTLLIGDHIMVDQTYTDDEVARGDIIVFRYLPDTRKDFIKRIIGLPDDSFL